MIDSMFLPKIRLNNLQPFLLPALRTSSLVGTILVSINQFEAVYGDGQISWLKLVLTYCVPFCVYIYSAIKNSKQIPDKQKVK